MKKTLIAVVLSMLVLPIFAADAAVAPAKVTYSASTGIALNNVASAVVVKNGSIGIQGLLFRFLDENREGFQIPVSVSFSENMSELDENYSSAQTGFSLSTGYNYIRKLYSNEFIAVNNVSGAGISYMYSFRNSVNPYSDYIDASFTLSCSISTGIEIEVPLGRLFSLPPYTICLSSGVSVYCGLAYGEAIRNNGEFMRNFNFNVGTGSFGTNLTSLGIRYYF